jgi:hypothetical protein
MDEGRLMTNYNTGFQFGRPVGNNQEANGFQGFAAGPTGQFSNVNRALGSPAGRMGTQALMGMLNGQNPGQAALGAGMDYGKNALMKYGTKQLLGGALGGQAAGFLGGPYGMLATAALPYLSKGISSLGKSLGFGGGNKGPSEQELAMGQAKGNLMNMRGSYGTDMGTGQSMLNKYNPMLESQIGKMQDLADRGLSSEYNTRQMAGAAANTENARRAAESRMRSTGGMLGGGQALSGYGGINQAAVGGMAQGAYNAAQNNMNSQPGYINQLSGMIGGQINRGQNLFNSGRQGMMGLDQNMYNLNAQEKARADSLSQSNRAREAQMIGGVANLAGTAAGMEQSRRQNRDFMNMMYPQDSGTNAVGDFQGTGATDSEGIARELLYDETYGNGGYDTQNPSMSNDYNNNYNAGVDMPRFNNPRGGMMGSTGLAEIDPDYEFNSSKSQGIVNDFENDERRYNNIDVGSGVYPNNYREGSYSQPVSRMNRVRPNTEARDPEYQAQQAQYVQNMIRQMFGGR